MCVIMSSSLKAPKASAKALDKGFTLVVPVSAKAQALASMGLGARLAMPPAVRRHAGASSRSGASASRRAKHPQRAMSLEW